MNGSDLSTTVAEILDAYLDGLKNEREFDAPFIVLLRGLGFYDIHFLHGKWEFGKDFIAKRVEDGVIIQYAFQSKGGDVDLAAWRDGRQQVDELRRNALGHAHFDRTLARRAVFLTTGRLTGGAPMEVQEYKRFLDDLGELTFDEWERSDLVDLLQQVPLLGLTPAPALVRALLDIEDDRFADGAVERLTRRWMDETFHERPWGAGLEAAILAGALARRHREDLAAETAAALLRAGWFWAMEGAPDWDAVELSRIGRALFATYAVGVWERCGPSDLDPVAFINERRVPFAFVGYPVASLKLANLLALLVLLLREERRAGAALLNGSVVDAMTGVDADTEERVRAFLVNFVRAHPGVSHPISDRWAAPMVNTVTAISSEVDLTQATLRAVAVWIVRQYDEGLGLAGWSADEGTEIRLLLGGPLEHVTDQKRDQSYLASVVLDLCAVLGIEGVYEDLRADLTSVGIFPTILEVPDTVAQYRRDHADLRQVPNVPYRLFDHAGDWVPSAVHARLPDSYALTRVGRPWDLMAIATLLRDRHFTAAIKDLLEERASEPEGLAAPLADVARDET